ncbi:trypsin-like peptidase domain-containing protein [Fontimonas sp. SYSU GA230001]|uniref:trypsin-like peptidase domain-containing protein n=1 Tax=Fontimonas sp. SYSU GA230001 TaxID=3142450 RepID=UPI0032B39EE7
MITAVRGRWWGGLCAVLACAPWPAGAQTAACQTVNYSCEAAASDTVTRAGRSTVLLRIPGAFQCTGTLVNNGRNDGRPFILTARHCAGAGDMATQAAAMEIAYDYEQPCAGGAARTPVSTFGAIHRATYQDLWLVEALDAPPVEADAYYAGLNAGTSTGTSQFGVHHGSGRPKQFVEQRISSGNIAYVVGQVLNLVISTWHTDLIRGTTPYGSSGSALFDAEARVLGVLSVGVICAGNVTGNDYQQLATAWTGDGSPQTSVKPWLDPDGAGFQLLPGRWPQEAGAPPGGTPGGGGSGGGGGGGGAFTLLGWLWIAAALRILRAGATRF